MAAVQRQNDGANGLQPDAPTCFNTPGAETTGRNARARTGGLENDL